MRCPYCKKEIDNESSICPECGKNVEEALKRISDIKRGKVCLNCRSRISGFNQPNPLWSGTEVRFCWTCRKKIEQYLNTYGYTFGDDIHQTTLIPREFFEEKREDIHNHGISESSIRHLLKYADNLFEENGPSIETWEQRKQKLEIARQQEELYSKCRMCGKPVSSVFVGKYKIKDGVICAECFARATRAGELLTVPSEHLGFEQLQALDDKRKSDEQIAANFTPTFAPAQYALFNDETQQMILSSTIHLRYSPAHFTCFNYAQIVDFALLEDGASIASGGLGRAAIGGLLFGGVGAVVGGVTRGYKSTCTKLQIKLTVKDYVLPAFFITLLNSETKKSSFIYKMYIKEAESILSKLQLITDSIASNTSEQLPPIPAIDIPDQIRKYKSLMDDGIISQEEFELKKKELLRL